MASLVSAATTSTGRLSWITCSGVALTTVTA
jgi:hypothetical protein